MKRLIDKLVGTVTESSFEKVLYNGMCFFGFILAIIIIAINIVLGMYPEIKFALLPAVFMGGMYYMARFKNRYWFFSLYVFTALLTSASYLRGLGIHGVITMYMLVIFVYALSYNNVKQHGKVFAFHMGILCLLFFLEYRYPNLVLNPFESEGKLHNALVIAIILCVSALFFGVNFLRRSYDAERIRNRRQAELLEKAAEEKSMFFINLSHEIKTPLTLIGNYIDKYIEEKEEDEKLIIIQQNIRKMQRDILDYLDIENLERGKASYEIRKNILLSKILEDKIVLFAFYATNKGIDLNYDIADKVYVKTNPKGLEQVLNNLLENAIKYTPESGKIIVTLKNEKDTAKLIVQNMGTVMPAEQLQHLFKPFHQLSNEKQNAQGVGMGLHIVKKVLDTTGGQIEINSNNEIGVVFTVTLPIGTADDAPERYLNNIMPIINTTAKAKDSPYTTLKKNLLVVEDNNDLLSYLVNELQQEYNIFVADSGLTAIERLENIPVPELIISDIMMDGVDGYGLLEKTLTDERFTHIPFIFLTAKNTSKERIDGLAAGAIDFITKPFHMEELRIKINTIIKQKERITETTIRELKKQFADEHLTDINQKIGEIFKNNAEKFKLTRREIEIMKHIRQGLKYEEIGNILHISEYTVIRHAGNLHEKTGTSSKVELINKLYTC